MAKSLLALAASVNCLLIAMGSESLSVGGHVGRGEERAGRSEARRRAQVPAASGNNASTPEDRGSAAAVCEELSRRGNCGMAGMGEVCSVACSAHGLDTPAGGGAAPLVGHQPIATSCAVLLELDGGCAHDLSTRDPAAAAGTRVSDLCPEQCSGHGGCAAAAVDISFLADPAEDSSGHSCAVVPGGDACVGGDGVTMSGQGHVSVTTGADYAQGGAFLLTFWLLKAPHPEIDMAEFEMETALEMLFSHPPRVIGGDYIQVFLLRDPWLDHYTLSVKLNGIATHTARLNLHRDSVPIWVHISIRNDHGELQILVDDVQIGVEGHGAVNDLAMWSPSSEAFTEEQLADRGVDVDLRHYDAWRCMDIDLDTVLDDWAGLPVVARPVFAGYWSPWAEFESISWEPGTWHGPAGECKES